MNKTMSVLLMSFIGLVGTFAWAGSAREDTVDRLQKFRGCSARHHVNARQRYS